MRISLRPPTEWLQLAGPNCRVRFFPLNSSPRAYKSKRVCLQGNFRPSDPTVHAWLVGGRGSSLCAGIIRVAAEDQPRLLSLSNDVLASLRSNPPLRYRRFLNRIQKRGRRHRYPASECRISLPRRLWYYPCYRAYIPSCLSQNYEYIDYRYSIIWISIVLSSGLRRAHGALRSSRGQICVRQPATVYDPSLVRLTLNILLSFDSSSGRLLRTDVG